VVPENFKLVIEIGSTLFMTGENMSKTDEVHQTVAMSEFQPIIFYREILNISGLWLKLDIKKCCL